MVLVLGEKEKNYDVLKIECHSAYGRGFMYSTKTSLVLEAVKKRLIYFEVLHTQILSLVAEDRKKVTICWVEGSTAHEFEFKIDDAPLYVKQIVESHNYEGNYPDVLGKDTVKLTDKDKNKIIDKRLSLCGRKIKELEKQLAEENNKLSSIQKDSTDYKTQTVRQSEIISSVNKTLQMWKQYKSDIPNIEINRHSTIPKYIPNHLCWFDCWFDERIKCYITFNFKLLKNLSFDFDESVQKFKKQSTLPNAHAVPEKYVGFVNGYPAVLEQFVEKFFKEVILKNNTTIPSIILPNMTSDMLTDELMSKWHGVTIEPNTNNSYDKIPKSIHYYLSLGSRIILTNNARIRYSQKEREFLEARDAFPERHKPFLP